MPSTPVTQPANPNPDITFTATDCELFTRYPASVSWAAVPKSDQDLFKSIRERLKKLSEALAASPAAPLTLKAETSLPTPNGRSPTEIWCCVYPSSVPNKSYGLQVALILSVRGAEVCFCQGSGTSQVADPAKKQQFEQALSNARSRLSAVPQTVIQSVEAAQKRKWFYRNSWLLKPNEGEFKSFAEWLQYASSSEGSSASVSAFFSPADVQALGRNVFTVFAEALETFAPVLRHVYSPPYPTSGLAQLLRRYFEEKIVFSSSVRSVRYAVTSWNENGVEVERLDANDEPQHVTFAQAEKLIQQVQDVGTLPFTTLDATSAVRNSVIQAERLALTADKTQIKFLGDPELRLQNFLNALGNLNMANPLYKPAMLLCVLDGIDQGELPENQITFDWIAPRFITAMKSLGKDVTEQQAAQPFYHLSGDLFWLHAVANLKDIMQDGGDGPTAARKKIKYALIKDTYWNLLQDPTRRAAVRQKLESMLMSPLSADQILSPAQAAVEATGFLSPSGQVRRFISALVSKPFVILTGNSGTGKTKLAQLIAHWLTGEPDESRNGYAVVPVGADWTDNRNIVGFVNHLRKPDGQNPIYQSTPVLDLLLRAKANPIRPYFLILDEMNLSHVERYFSDFLSAIESKKQVPLHNEKQALQTAGGASVPNSIPFTDNLFVIGTVNVDETTYMFSPKVLDRANVLEFRIALGDAETFMAQASEPIKDIAPAPRGTAEAFLLLSRHARGLSSPGLAPISAGDLDQCQETLKHLFRLLHYAQLEFAFRTIAEVVRYLQVDLALAKDKSAWRWEDGLDAQLLQKILPKLHGSRRRLEAILVALAIYCEKREPAPAQERLKKDADLSNYPQQTAPNSVALPLSRAKLIEMLEAVRRDQFVSFIQ